MTSSEFLKKFSKIQPIIGVVIIFILTLWGKSLNQNSVKLSFSLIAGVLFGYILTRSRFGFAGGIKRIYVRGEGSLTKALLLTFATTTIIYGSIQWIAASNGAVPAFLASEGEVIIPGTQNVHMANIGTVAGGFIFGIGMIIAGGCASGTLADLGEGEGHAAIAFPLFVLGTIPGHFLRARIDNSKLGEVGVRIHLPEYFGYVGSILITIILLT